MVSEALASCLGNITMESPVSNEKIGCHSCHRYGDTLILTQPELLPNSPSCIAYCFLTRPVLFLLASLERL